MGILARLCYGGYRAGNGDPMGAVKQRGFMLYAGIAALIAIAGLTIALKVQTSRLGAVKQEYAGFQAQVKALGEIAQEKAKQKEAEDKKLKARLDDENKKLRDNLAVTGKRLRDSIASSGTMPQLPAPPHGADTITLERAGINRALREHVTEVRGILEEITGLFVEGAQATIDLNAAKAFIQEQTKK